jgi:hypothetical protein
MASPNADLASGAGAVRLPSTGIKLALKAPASARNLLVSEGVMF